MQLAQILAWRTVSISERQSTGSIVEFIHTARHLRLDGLGRISGHLDRQGCGAALVSCTLNVRLRHIADVPLALTNVRIEGNNGHDADVLLCWLMTQSGNREWPKCANGRGKFQPIFVTGNKSIVVSHRTPQWPEEFSNVLG